MKIIKNSIDSEDLQDSISDADLEKQMVECGMESELSNGHHPEEIQILEKSNMNGVEVSKLSNGVLEKSGGSTKCKGKVNGFYEEEEDFNLVLEDSSDGGDSPSKKIEDDVLSAPQIVQEIKDLLELNDLDGTESIEDNLDNVEDIDDGTEIQEILKDIDEDKIEEHKCSDIGKREIAQEEIKTPPNKKILVSNNECDTSSHMNVVVDEIEVGMENENVVTSTESDVTIKSDEIECKIATASVSNKSEKLKDCSMSDEGEGSEVPVDDKVDNNEKSESTIEEETPIVSKGGDGVENNKITSITAETTSEEISLTQSSSISGNSEEWMVLDAIETLDEDICSETQKSSSDAKVINESPLTESTKLKIEPKIDLNCSVSSTNDNEANKMGQTNHTSENSLSTSIQIEGDGVKKGKRSAPVDQEDVELLKKPKLDAITLVESTSPVLKRPLPITVENDTKRTRRSENAEECKVPDDENCQVEKSGEVESKVISDSLKDSNITDTLMPSNIEDKSHLSEKDKALDPVINKVEETHSSANSSSDTTEVISENKVAVEPINVIQQSSDVLISNDSASTGDNTIDPKSSRETTNFTETTVKEDKTSIKDSSKQNSDNVISKNTVSESEESKRMSEDESKDSGALKKENDGKENKESVTTISNDSSKEEAGFKLDDLSSVSVKEPTESVKTKEITSITKKAETNPTDVRSTHVSISKELSSSIKELEKSLNKGIPEKVLDSENLNKTDSKKMTNLDFAIERVVEKARIQVEKKVPILKKFHKDQLKKLTRSELEDIVLSKICEAVTYKSEIGQMRLRTQNLEETNEMWRKKVQQIEKQNRELEMVLKRFLTELSHIKRENQNKVPMPIKVTRSVGLQVVLASSMHGALVSSRNKMSTDAGQQQNQQVSAKGKSIEKEKTKEPAKTSFTTPNNSITGRRGRPVKTLPPQNSSRPSTPQTMLPKVLPPTPPKPATPVKTIASPNKDLEVIDLTDREEKAKLAPPPPSSGQIRVAPSTQVCFVQQSAAPAQTQQPLYLVQKTGGPRPQYLVATSSASPSFGGLSPDLQQRPMANTSRPPPALALPVFRGGHLIPVQTTPAVGVKTSTNTSSAGVRQVPPALRFHSSPSKHPAPLPAAPVSVSKPGMKAPPPKPQLKIAKTNNGIMLSWSMSLTKDMAEMQSYQLYAYQEGNQPPSTGLWKKVGDVKALPLPMACTLTQFIEGHKYHFAVRAVDTHGRIGPFSTPSSILLTK